MEILSLIQSCLFDFLNKDKTLFQMISGVYSHVPESAILPYLYMVDATINRLSLLSGESYDIEITIRACSDATSAKTCLDIMTVVKALLDGQTFKTKNWDISKMQANSFTISKDKHNLIWQGDLIVHVRAVYNTL